MSHERIPVQTAELHGMTDQQHQKAMHSIESIKAAEQNVVDIERDADRSIDRALRPHPMDPEYDWKLMKGSVAVPAREIMFGAKLVVADWQVRSAHRKAERHYNKNQAAYQEQAIKDAHDAGVELNR